MSRISKLFSFGLAVLLATGLLSTAAFAQEVQIQFPQEGQQVRGQITVRFSGIPDGGYVVVKVDGNFATATSQPTFVLNTFPPTFSGDGTHKVTITGINAGGKNVSEKTVSFEVANNRVDVGGEGVRLTHYVNSMRLDDNVQRYRLFAESNATIDDGGGAGGGGGMGGAGGGDSGEAFIPAPLDWQISGLMRRIVRDVGMFSDAKSDGVSSANIRTVVQEAYQHQRESESGTGGGGGAMGGTTKKSSKKKKSGGPTKAPWKKDWESAPEIGQYFVKMIEPSGKEINATRKAPTIAIADLLPTFPEADVRPGSTWETRMTFIGDLSSRQPVNVSVPITFTSFESVKTVSGENRRTAKLESRFQMPEDLAKKMAINLILQGGSSKTGGAGGGGEGGPGGAGGGGGMTGPSSGGSEAGKTWNTLDPEELQEYMEAITSVRASASRVLWFDIENHCVLRSEDIINSYYEYEEATETEGGGGMGGGMDAGGAGGAGGAESGPQKVTYGLVVTTWLDDSIPAATPKYAGSTSSSRRDNTTDPSIGKLLTKP